MKSKQQLNQNMTSTTKKFDVINVIKWSIVVLLFSIGFVANYYYVQYPLSLRLIGWLILVAIMAVIAIRTSQGRHLWKFFREAQGEMKKVVWPNRRETFQTTMIVIAIVVIFSLLIWVVDMFLMWMVNWLTGQL